MKPGAITKTVNDTPLTEQFYKQLGLRKPLADRPFAHARSNAGIPVLVLFSKTERHLVDARRIFQAVQEGFGETLIYFVRYAGGSLIGSVVRPYHEVLHSFGNDTMMAAMYAERARKSGPYHHVKCYYNAELGKVV